MLHLDSIDFLLGESDSDILGDAYEYLIGQFAAGAGKKAGEFYTPQSVSTILARIVTTGKTRLKSVYDPTCGSGSLLLRVAREVEHVGDFYGQEMNRTTYNLARMNMILHGIHFRNFDIRQEDTLERPQHPNLRFEAVVANPPFSAKWSASKRFETDDRFSQYGKLAPASKADFAFVQHMLHQLEDSGTMAVVLPHGVLFRGAAEGAIRRYLIEERNWLDAVIGLPANIFYGTGIPTCVLVFKKCRQCPEDILFIDASAHFEKAKNQNRLRPEDIDKIVATYRGRMVEEKYSYRATLKEIRENDFNLNIPRHVDTFKEEEPVDLAAVVGALEVAQKSFNAGDLDIAKYCDELNIPNPIGCNLHLLREYKRGIMQKLLSQELRFKQGDGSDFPDWEPGHLKDLILSLDAGISVNSGDKPAGSSEKGVLKTSCVSFGYFLSSENKVVISEEEIRRLKEPVEAGTVLISRMNTPVLVGANAYVYRGFPNLYLPDRLWAAKIKPEHSSEWVGILLSSERIRAAFSARATGTSGSMKNITKSDVLTVPTTIPSLKEQQKIASFLSAIGKKIESVGRQIDQVEQFKKGLLQKMFV